MTEKCKRLFTGLAGSPLARVEGLVASTPISRPSPDELKRLESESRKQLGIIDTRYLRKLFEPPLSVENVAMFLVLPQVLYFIDEEKPPRIHWEKVHTLPIPFMQTDRKHPLIDGHRAPLFLREKLVAVIEELQTTLTAKQSKAAGGLTGVDLTKARRMKRAERKRIEKEINRYETEWIKEDIPATGRESFEVLVPRCERVEECLRRYNKGYTLSEIKKYIRAAWGATISRNGTPNRQSLTIWERQNNALLSFWGGMQWGEFENAVICRAVAAGIFSPLPQFQKYFVSHISFPQIPSLDAPLDHSRSAAEQAQSGYTASARFDEDDDDDKRRAKHGDAPDRKMKGEK